MVFKSGARVRTRAPVEEEAGEDDPARGEVRH